MLFNSFNFSFIFLPIVILTSIILKKYFHTQFLIIFLIISSLIFYSYYYPPYIFLIMYSIFFNYISSYLLIKYNRKKINIYIFSITILVNLLILLYYKYFNFLVQNIGVIFTLKVSEKELILPLAISFFTFQQIAFITSVFRKEIRKVSFIKYSLIVSFSRLILFSYLPILTKSLLRLASLKTFVRPVIISPLLGRLSSTL